MTDFPGPPFRADHVGSPLRPPALLEARGRQVIVERDTPNQQASTSWVTPWRRCTRVASKPVEEHQAVPGTGPDRPLPRPIGQSCVLTRLPAGPQLGDQFS